MDKIKNSYKVDNSPYLKSLVLLMCIVLIIFELLHPFVIFPFYEGRNPNYNNSGDVITIAFLEIFTFVCAILFIIFILLRDTWEIEITNKYIILRDIWKKEKKFLLKDIKKIDKVRINNEGFKTWALIGKKTIHKGLTVVDRKKVPITVRNKVGEKLKFVLEQYKQNESLDHD